MSVMSFISNIPDVKGYIREYVFETLKLKHKPETLWLEFGTASGKSINYFSKFTDDLIYGFDSFLGLPEDWRESFKKGAFTTFGELPTVNNNVVLIKGLFNDTLTAFLKQKNKMVSFIHIDCDLYSSTKYVLNELKDYIDEDCVVIFDELLNYEGYDNDKGELKALYEFINENSIPYEWIGMNGSPVGMPSRAYHQNVALIFRPNKFKRN